MTETTRNALLAQSVEEYEAAVLKIPVGDFEQAMHNHTLRVFNGAFFPTIELARLACNVAARSLAMIKKA